MSLIGITILLDIVIIYKYSNKWCIVNIKSNPVIMVTFFVLIVVLNTVYMPYLVVITYINIHLFFAPMLKIYWD